MPNTSQLFKVVKCTKLQTRSLSSVALLALLHLTHAHRGSGHRHGHTGRFMASEPPTSAETTLGQKQPDPLPNPSTPTSTLTNDNNYIKFTEFLHLNFSHSKQFTGMPGQINEPSASFDPFAALRQLLPVMPTAPAWNSWTQLQSTGARIGTGQPEPQMPVQVPNIVPNLQPTNLNPNVNTKQNGFNNNYK